MECPSKDDRKIRSLPLSSGVKAWKRIYEKKRKKHFLLMSSSDAETSSQFAFVALRKGRVNLYMASFLTVVRTVHPGSSASPRENGKSGLQTSWTKTI